MYIYIYIYTNVSAEVRRPHRAILGFSRLKNTAPVDKSSICKSFKSSICKSFRPLAPCKSSKTPHLPTNPAFAKALAHFGPLWLEKMSKTPHLPSNPAFAKAFKSHFGSL